MFKHFIEIFQIFCKNVYLELTIFESSSYHFSYTYFSIFKDNNVFLGLRFELWSLVLHAFIKLCVFQTDSEVHSAHGGENINMHKYIK